MYINTESDTGSQITRLSQFFLDENNPDVVDYDSEIIILDLEQPFDNHNGATVSTMSVQLAATQQNKHSYRTRQN